MGSFPETYGHFLYFRAKSEPAPLVKTAWKSSHLWLTKKAKNYFIANHKANRYRNRQLRNVNIRKCICISSTELYKKYNIIAFYNPPHNYMIKNFAGHIRRLDSNPLNCTCEILWLTRLLKNTPNTENAATCGNPEDLKGKALVKLTPEDFNCSK